jgi:hypothetical protein
VNFEFQQDAGDDDEGVDSLSGGIRCASAQGGVAVNFPMVSKIRIAGDFGRPLPAS